MSSASAVTVEDESTKRCSVCAEDRPSSDYSSAQLKKKGKRVCHASVAMAAAQQEAAHRAAAAARKETMKGDFATKLNATPPHSASTCPRCKTRALRVAPCSRCTVECCSLKCFDQHDCDAYLEGKHTMPTVLIPEVDRFESLDAPCASQWRGQRPIR